MKKVHLISVQEPFMFDLALALRNKEYEVSASGIGLSDSQITRLQDAGVLCEENGWFPSVVQKELHCVVLGAQADQSNPELEKAKELGLYIVSIPEFIFLRTKNKTRFVVSGSKDKRAILSIMAFVLKKQRITFDYALMRDVPEFDSRVHLSFEARVALIEGDEHLTSILDKRFKLEYYRPHVAVVSNIDWIVSSEYPTFESYIEMYRDFFNLIERDGKLIYSEKDATLKSLASQVREDITSIPFETHATTFDENGRTCLDTRYGLVPVYSEDPLFVEYLNAARLACRQIGVNDKAFYSAIAEYKQTLS